MLPSFAKYVLKKVGCYYPAQYYYRKLLQLRTQRTRLKIYEQFRGPGFECNFCNASFSKFAPYHASAADAAALLKHEVVAGYGHNIFCPQCSSTARERLIRAVLEHHYPIRKASILHLAPELKLNSFLNRENKIITADIEPGFYQFDFPSVQRQDLTQLTYGDNEFDVVIANHVLEHINNDRKAMQEIFRVLKSKGRAILQVPIGKRLATTLETSQPNLSDSERSMQFGQKDHVRIYALDDYCARLRTVGFTVSLLTSDTLHAFANFAIQEDEVFFDIRKP
jgi:SAM-dependent methyltransferase